MLFASECAGCGRPGQVLCRVCRFELARPVLLAESTSVLAAVPFTGRARRVLLSYKYGNRRQVAHHLAGLLVNRIVAAGLDAADFDIVTWAPTSASRRARRGFDQAEVVARRVAGQLGLPCRRLLARHPRSGAQTGRAREQRLHGPVFRARPSVGGLRVLVIDDVATTGSTLRSAEAALRLAGAQSVQRAAVASTPALVPARRRSPAATAEVSSGMAGHLAA